MQSLNLTNSILSFLIGHLKFKTFTGTADAGFFRNTHGKFATKTFYPNTPERPAGCCRSHP